MVQREHLAAFLAVMVAFPVQYYLQNNFSLSQVRNTSTILIQKPTSWSLTNLLH